MPDELREYLPAKKAAERIGISYELLIYRIRRKQYRAKKNGWALFLHKDDVRKYRRRERRKKRTDKKG